MNVLSLFSGVGGIDLGLEAAGMTTVAFCEIDPHARSVLAHHWPDTPIIPDVKDVTRDSLPAPVDLVCGGFPCQDISVAGRRKGLAGERSGLWWEFHRILSELTPAWCLIENVDGLRSSNDGRDLGAILGALGDLGYGWSYRVLDARGFGVPQRRRRVFIVGHLGDRRAAEVLLEPEGGGGDPQAGVEAGADSAAGADGGADLGREYVGSLTTAFDAKNYSNLQEVMSGSIVPVAVSENQRGEVLLTPYSRQITTGGGKPGQGYPAVLTGGIHASNQGSAVATLQLLRNAAGAEAVREWATRGLLSVHAEEVLRQEVHGSGLRPTPDDLGPVMGDGALPRPESLPAGTVLALRCLEGFRRSPRGRELAEQLTRQPGASVPVVPHEAPPDNLAVRRLTPREAERLMGWPDDHTRWAADGSEIADSHRYRMCGNGVVAPVAEWIGRRIVAAS